MKSKNLRILLMVTVLLVAFAYYRDTQQRERDRDIATSGDPVFPAMDINRVAQLTLDDGQARVTIQRSDDRWIVVEKHGYAADFSRVRDLLLRIADLRVGRSLHLDDRLLGELALLRPDATENRDQSGMHIALNDNAGTLLATLTLGKTFYGDRDTQRDTMPFQWRDADGRYVVTHQGDAFLVSEPFQRVDAKPDEWLDRGFLDVPSRALVTLAWEGLERDTILLTREQTQDPWQLEALPDDRELDSASIDALIRTLRNLAFDDIVDPSLADEMIGMSAAHVVTLTARADDGRRYNLAIGDAATIDNRTRHALRVSAAYDLLPAPLSDMDDESAKQHVEIMHQHAETIDRINERLSGWTYWIDTATAEKLRIDRDDILNEPEPPEEPDSNND